jgi:hypothetical protein
MVDLRELRKLAEEANERGGWYPAGVMWDVLIEALQSQTAKEDAAYIAAASPDVVLGLLDEIERLKGECDFFSARSEEERTNRGLAEKDFHDAMELVRQYSAERDQLRAEKGSAHG